MTNESSTTDERSERPGGNPLPADRKAIESSSAEPVKPPIFWLLLPIVLIAIAVYLAR